jgi:methanogenic corrinoid protein MtbC1
MDTTDRPDRPDQPNLPSLPLVDAAAGTDLGESITPELLAGLLADGDDELAAWALGNALEHAPREVVYDGLLRDAMALIGSRWRSGTWGIAEEHAASQALTRALDRLAPRRGPLRRVGPFAVVAGVREERHTLGLVCLAHILEDAGFTVVNLGGDEPADDLARYAGRMRPGLIGITASDPARAADVADAVHAIDALGLQPRPAIMVGGRIAATPEAIAGLSIDWVGTQLVDAAAFSGALAERLEADGPTEAPDEIF